jgi:hypothetical protein
LSAKWTSNFLAKNITMLETVSPFLAVLTSGAKAMTWFNDLRKQTKGDVRALVEELKENSRLCFHVLEDHVAPEEVIPRLSTVVFDRLNESGFDFDAVKRARIPKYDYLVDTDLASWIEKPTSKLIENIYDKIKEIRTIHTINAKGSILRGRRIINIHKRMMLLLRHVRG